MYQFRDPIHGFIAVSVLELAIVDSVPFQRLRNIRQLATTYLVYHGAEHTRFGHSLGVMHLVSRAFDNAVENYYKLHGKQLFPDIDKAWYRQILRLIALTHDLGHAPFSHGTEALFGKGTEHEEFTKKILYETEVSQLIKNIGEEFRAAHGASDNYNITPELLWLIYGDKNPELNPSYKFRDYKFLKCFMDSELDCDKMDYLLRDSYYCGVNYGKYDLERLLSSLNVYKNEEHHLLQLAIEKAGVPAFEEFVIARYFMFIQVYFHKTRRFLDILLSDVIRQAIPEYPSSVDEYLKLDDNTVLEKIRKLSVSSEIAKQFLARKVMRCVYESRVHSPEIGDIREYNHICKRLKKAFPDNKFPNCILEDFADKMPHKIPIVEQYLNENNGKGIPVLIKHNNIPHSITSESILLRGLDKSINIKRIYVDKKIADEAETIVKEFLAEGGGEYERKD